MSVEFAGVGVVELERLREQVRGDRRPSSVPLLVFGALTLAAAPFAGDLSLWRLLYWSVAGPLGFLAVAWWYRQRKARTGIGAGRAPYARAGMVVLAAFVLVLPLTVLQMPVIGLALLALAWSERNVYLGAFAVVFAVIGGLEQFTATWENLLYRAADTLGWFQQDYGYFRGAPTAVTAAAGGLLLVGGVLALRRERRSHAG